MKIPPQDVLRIMDELPQSLLDEVQMTMVMWSGLEFIKMGPKQPSEKAFSQFMDRSHDKFVALLRDAKRRHDQVTGEKSC
jgi:hypothetical protein